MALLVISLAANLVMGAEIYGAFALAQNNPGMAVCAPMTAYTGPLGLVACKPEIVNQ